MNQMHTLLFLRKHSSARDQIVEGLARKLFGARLVVLSAGHETAEPHPLALAVLHEAGVDPSASLQERLTRFRAARDQIQARLDVMLALLDLPQSLKTSTRWR